MRTILQAPSSNHSGRRRQSSRAPRSLHDREGHGRPRLTTGPVHVRVVGRGAVVRFAGVREQAAVSPAVVHRYVMHVGRRPDEEPMEAVLCDAGGDLVTPAARVRVTEKLSTDPNPKQKNPTIIFLSLAGPLRPAAVPAWVVAPHPLRAASALQRDDFSHRAPCAGHCFTRWSWPVTSAGGKGAGTIVEKFPMEWSHPIRQWARKLPGAEGGPMSRLTHVSYRRWSCLVVGLAYRMVAPES